MNPNRKEAMKLSLEVQRFAFAMLIFAVLIVGFDQIVSEYFWNLVEHIQYTTR